MSLSYITNIVTEQQVKDAEHLVSTFNGDSEDLLDLIVDSVLIGPDAINIMTFGRAIEFAEYTKESPLERRFVEEINLIFRRLIPLVFCEFLPGEYVEFPRRIDVDIHNNVIDNNSVHEIMGRMELVVGAIKECSEIHGLKSKDYRSGMDMITFEERFLRWYEVVNSASKDDKFLIISLV